MTRKRSGFALSIIGLILFEFLFFSWATFPRSILSVFLINLSDKRTIISELLTRSVFFLLFMLSWVMIIPVISENREISKERRNKCFVLLLLTQILVDCVNLLLVSAFYRYKSISADLCTICGWLVVALLSKRWLTKEISENKHFKMLPLLFLMLFIAATFLNIRDISAGNALAEKYYETSEYYRVQITNLDFFMQIRTMLLDCLCGLAVLWMIFRITPNREEALIPKSKQISLVLLRANLLLAAIFFVAILKAAVLPVSSIGFYSSRITHDHSFWDNSLQVDSRYSSLYRNNSNRAQDEFYASTSCDVWFCNQKLFSFKTPGINDGYTGMNTFGKKENKSWIVKEQDRKTFHLFDGNYFVWTEEETSGLVRLNGEEGDVEIPELIQFLERLQKESLWPCPEFGFKYLLKWDYDFIQPYLARYANGNFTKEELENNPDYRPDYIMQLATKLLASECEIGGGSSSQNENSN